MNPKEWRHKLWCQIILVSANREEVNTKKVETSQEISHKSSTSLILFINQRWKHLPTEINVFIIQSRRIGRDS